MTKRILALKITKGGEGEKLGKKRYREAVMPNTHFQSRREKKKADDCDDKNALYQGVPHRSKTGRASCQTECFTGGGSTTTGVETFIPHKSSSGGEALVKGAELVWDRK